MKKRRRSRRSKELRIPEWVKERLVSLSREREICADSTRKGEIRKEQLELRRMITLPPTKNPTTNKPKTSGSGKPSSMFTTFSAGWVRFVQGGSPGSGRGGKR